MMDILRELFSPVQLNAQRDCNFQNLGKNTKKCITLRKQYIDKAEN